MASMLETALAFFEREGWPVQLPEGEDTLVTGYEGEHGKWSCFALIFRAEERFVFYSIAPVPASAPQRQRVAEFITRANYGLALGNFEMDFERGEIRYKTSIDVEGAALSEALVRQLVLQNVGVMDRYLPGLMSVLYSDIAPAAAIAEVERH
ncbi:YbjN domain-containing protein [Myxococcota bacterium]|nr:YbjN domain-containing protein [Myxococcota bacterium]MBU1429551.1 YbjN domain-containing protein [Myxococcota bacterium]MBU1898533.1 YbjN domain-containing protein [Myxococcota bacterium]